MIKWTVRVFLLLVIITVFSLFFLSFYGLETDYFNSTIQAKVKAFNPNLNLEFQKTNILLDLKKLELKVKVKNPKINLVNTSTDLNKLNLNISIKHFLKGDFALQRGEVELIKTDIKQFIKLANQIKPSPYLFIVKEIFNKGQIEGKIKINFEIKHIPNLYWTAASIGGLIKAGKGSPETIVLLPQVGLLLDTALKLDSSWENGSIYTALISYTMSEFPVSNEKIKRVKYYFSEAVRLSDGKDARPYLAYAESVSVTNQDRDKFIQLLNKALAIPSTDNEEINLQNIIAGNRAKWLLSRTDELFY